MKTYHGSCHCGKVRFEVSAILDRIVECNCSYCAKKGGLLHRVAPKHFKLVSGDKDLGVYQFNTKSAKHYFCKHCGIHPFSNPRIAPDMFTINIRCLDDFDLQTENHETVKFDGRNWEESVEKLAETVNNK